MMDRDDWLRVVYGRGLEPSPDGGGEGSEAGIAVKQAPAELDLAGARRREQRVRVTVIPREPGRRWTLWLRDAAGSAPGSRGARVWWRVEPGTWQPLGEGGETVAAGRGRQRVDVSLRLDRRPAVSPELRFVAEPAESA